MNRDFVCEVGSEIVYRIIPHRIRIITRLYGLYGTSEALYVYTVYYTVYRISYIIRLASLSYNASLKCRDTRYSYYFVTR
jgi:hypothetical protein